MFAASVQVQPLSLEELLAKKKAEEEAEAKVSFPRFTSVFIFLNQRLVFPHFTSFTFLPSSAQIPLKSGARSRGSETAGARDGGKEEGDGRREEEEKDVPGHGEKNDGCVSGACSMHFQAICIQFIEAK